MNNPEVQMRRDAHC